MIYNSNRECFEALWVLEYTNNLLLKGCKFFWLKGTKKRIQVDKFREKRNPAVFTHITSETTWKCVRRISRYTVVIENLKKIHEYVHIDWWKSLLSIWIKNRRNIECDKPRGKKYYSSEEYHRHHRDQRLVPFGYQHETHQKATITERSIKEHFREGNLQFSIAWACFAHRAVSSLIILCAYIE